MLRRLLLCLGLLANPGASRAETGASAWLRYAALDEASARRYQSLPPIITMAGDGVVLQTAQRELNRGIQGMLARTLRAQPAGAGGVPASGAIVLGTLAQLRQSAPQLAPAGDLA